jgi:universal stress protein A
MRLKRRKTMLFNRILYPTDFSPLSEIAKDYVMKLREANAKEVILLHVINPLEFSLPQFNDPFALDVASIYAHVPEIEKKVMDENQRMLDKTAKELKSVGFKVKKKLTIGEPKDEIVRVANDEKVNLIVIGYHGKGLLERILEMGSTAKSVIRKAECPVLVVKRQG